MTRHRALAAATAVALLLLAVVFIVFKPFDDQSSEAESGSTPDTEQTVEEPSTEPKLQFLEEYELELLDEGWQRISPAQAAELRHVALGALPEGSEYGGIYVKADHSNTDEAMVVQFWCDPDRSWLLRTTQFAWPDEADKVGDVEFTGWAEDGRKIGEHYPGAVNYCAQEIVKDGMYVQMYMLVDASVSVYDCGEIMQSLQFPE